MSDTKLNKKYECTKSTFNSKLYTKLNIKIKLKESTQ